MNTRNMSDAALTTAMNKWARRRSNAEARLTTAPERLVDHLYDIMSDADREISAAQRELARRGHGW
jgi:hypothetical protein